jgi:indolepyruvate ferredoxin oxidoreductase beta subunit
VSNTTDNTNNPAATADAVAVNVLAVGVGGQGIITLTNILSQVAFEAGFDVKQSEIHGLSQRGGSVSGQVRWGAFGEKVHTPIIMEGEADFLLALEELEALRNAHFLKPGGAILVNDFSILPATVVTGKSQYPRDIDAQLAGFGHLRRVPATRIAQEMGNIRMSNIVMLGALSGQLGFPRELWARTIEQLCPPRHVQKNLSAFAKGAELMIAH